MPSPTCHAWFSSPIGDLLLRARNGLLTGLDMIDLPAEFRIPDDWREGGDAVLADAQTQLNAYFNGQLQRFDLPIELTGTSFQRRVWEELRQIAYGQTITYADLANRVGNANASRAVGGANGRNPIGIIVPCHRVIASGGTLGGYGGGLDRKLWLLRHEAQVLGRKAPDSWTRPGPRGGKLPSLVF